MPLSVLNGSVVAAGAPRNHPAKPGRPAPAVDTTSLTSTWKLAHWRRRVAPQGWPAGSGVFLSGLPSAWIRTWMVWAEFVPNGSAAPRPSAARTTESFVSPTVVVVAAVDVVVGAEVVVVDAFLSLEQAAMAVSSTADSRMRAARRRRSAAPPGPPARRIFVMAAQSSQWAPATAVTAE